MIAIPPYLMILSGLLLAFTAYLAARSAEARSRRLYHDLLGPDIDPPETEDWEEVRELVGIWGCAFVGFRLLLGLGVVMALAAGVYLIFF